MKKLIWVCLVVAVISVVWHWRVNDESSSQQGKRRGAEPAYREGDGVSGRNSTETVVATKKAIKTADDEGESGAPELLSIKGDPGYPHRLSNSGMTSSAMLRSDNSIMLRNARIDTTRSLDHLGIPEHLKSEGDPQAYIIQSVGVIDETFRSILREAGAETVSYIPHNSYLVNASAKAVKRIKKSQKVLAVVPYEPYYKLGGDLLPTAIDQEPLQQGAILRMGIFPGGRDNVAAKIEELGGKVVKEGQYPFGSVLDVLPGTENLVALAQMPEVMLLEPYATAVPLVDLSRPRLGIASNLTDTANLHGLTGAGVLVGLPGSGVDVSHPSLSGRVVVDSNSPPYDANGHETHVAGIIASDGTSIPGSFTNGSSAGSSYAGKAPASMIYPTSVLPASGDAIVRATNYPAATHNPNGSITGAVVAINLTYGSAGYQVAPIVSIIDSTPLTRSTNNPGPSETYTQVTPGQNARYEAQMSNGRVTAFAPQVDVTESYAISGGTLVTNYTTNVWTGSNYTETNVTVLVTPPWSDFQIITNQARHTNIYVVNNSWGSSLQEYNIMSATYDAAVRDSMPHWPDDQEINYVFAAGNSGFGNTLGQGGLSDSIVSPATAKNVITVGAIESQRNIPSNTNFPYAFPESDSDSQVADFSSRGNVGVGLEGDFGRFKPDLVAPGTWILSLAASTFDATNRTQMDNAQGNGDLRYESGTSMAAPAVSGMLALMQEFFATRYATTNSPALNKALLINSARPASSDYDYAVNAQINYQGWGVPLLSNAIPADFRFLTNNQGSAEAQVVAVDQGTFGTTNRLETGEVNTFRLSVDNGAKDFPVRITLAWTDPPGNPAAGVQLVNDLDLVVSNENSGEVYIGNNITSGNDFNDIGQPNLTNSSVVVEHDFVNNIENVFIPGPFTNSGSGAVKLTIQVKGKRVNVNALGASTNAVEQDYALVVSTVQGQKVTLDHESNLDYVTNRAATFMLNGIAVDDQVVGANHPFVHNGGGPDNAYGSTNQWNFYVFTNTSITNPPATVTTNISGSVTNTSTNVVSPLTNNGQYVAFITFFPPNASRARNDDADIDLYVTRSGSPPSQGAPNLTNLAAGILWEDETLRSTNRGGVEIVTFDDAAIGEVFYIGVKSEDQQGGRYGFLAISSTEAFTTQNPDGTIEIPFIPAPVEIPDGSPSSPGGVQLFGISTVTMDVISPLITNVIAHENFGDLSVSLTHNDTTIHLWNHNGLNSDGTYRTETRYFDATAYGTAGAGRMPDGPGDLEDFFEQDAIGLWILNITDDSLNHTGAVLEAGMIVGDRQNRDRETNGNRVSITFDIDPGASFIDVINVPLTATNMLVSVANAPDSDPGIDLLLAYNQVPAAPFFTNSYITNVNGTNFAVTNPVANTNVYSLVAPDTYDKQIRVNQNTQPRPLTIGPWYARVINNTSVRHTLTLIFDLEHNLGIGGFFGYESVLDHDLVDNGATNLLISVPDYRTVAEVEVGVGIEHPRPSDLVLHLIAPSGKKVLLFENRGDTNRSHLFANFTEDTNLNTAVISDFPGAGDMHHYSNLVEIKWITNQFTNIISPPRLLTSNRVQSAHHVIPEAIAIPGNSVYVVGAFRDNAAGSPPTWGMALNYPLPFTNDAAHTMPTNWLTTWPTNMVVSASDSTSVNRGDATVFQDLVATTQGVFMVAVTNKEYFPVIPIGRGYTNQHRLDIDTGCTDGTFNFNLGTFTVPDHFHVYYEGSVIPAVSVDYPGIGNGGGVDYSTPFSGSDSFVRLVINQGGNTSPGTAWDLNSISYQCTTPTPAKNVSIVLGYDPNGPVALTDDRNVATNGATMISRAVTNNPYGVLGDDRLHGITSQFETGLEDLGDESSTDVTRILEGTNYLYVTGSAQFDLSNTDEKFFLSKVTDDGITLWTATEQVGAGATVQHSGGMITGFDIYCPGTNYSAAPTVTIVDLHSQATATATATAAINPVTGHVTSINVVSGGVGYQQPVVYIEKPALAGTFGSAGLDVAVIGGTNVYAVGYSNTVANGSASAPTIWAYDDQGCLLWTRQSLYDGEFTAVQVVRDNIYVVGRNRRGSGQTSSIVQKWDRSGNVLLSMEYDLGKVSATRQDSFDDLLVMQNPDRLYAVGTRTNADTTTDALLAEIETETLNLVSLRTPGDGTGLNNERGKGIATDEKDIYILVESTHGGVIGTEIHQYRVRNYYYSEESLDEFEAEPSWYINGNVTNRDWTLRVWDNRAGNGGTTTPKIRYWNLNMKFAALGTPSQFVNTSSGFTGTLLSTAPKYYWFEVLPGQNSVKLNINSPGSISAAVSSNGLPSFENSENVLFQNSSGGSFILTNHSGGRLRAGRYYIAVQNGLETINNDFRISFQGDGDLPPVTVVPLLANGVVTNGSVSAGPGFSFYTFEVPVAATGARFELTSGSPDVNLFLRKDNGSGSPPSTSAFDYRSMHKDSGNELIFLIPDAGSTNALTPGTWYLGVQNTAANPASFSVKATSLTGSPYVITPVVSGQSVSGTTVVGNAPTNVYKLAVSSPKKGIVFEVTGLSGDGDLIVRKGAPPLLSAHTASSSGSAAPRKMTVVRTNATDLGLVGDWYFGVVNNGETNVVYTATATVPSGNLLLASTPLQLKSLPTPTELAGGDSFGFGLDVVPGETYQVQYSATPAGPWFVLTNIVAPPNAQIEFVHPNALSANSRLMYRIQQVP